MAPLTGSWLLLLHLASFWLPLATPGCSWLALCLVSAGSWLLLAGSWLAPGWLRAGSWLLLAGSWLLLAGTWLLLAGFPGWLLCSCFILAGSCWLLAVPGLLLLVWLPAAADGWLLAGNNKTYVTVSVCSNWELAVVTYFLYWDHPVATVVVHTVAA